MASVVEPYVGELQSKPCLRQEIEAQHRPNYDFQLSMQGPFNLSNDESTRPELSATTYRGPQNGLDSRENFASRQSLSRPPQADMRETDAPHQPNGVGGGLWLAKAHPNHEAISEAVDAYFLETWPFPNDRAREKFRQAGFSRVTCLYFPLAHNDRIDLACRLLTILFLIDDVLESKSLAEGEALNDRLMQVIKQETLPNNYDANEVILHDIFREMRRLDATAAEDIVRNTCIFMCAQTDKTRLKITEIGEYLKYRERDVGKSLLCALMRFAMLLELTASDLDELRDLERFHARHISVVNDIFSFEKEKRAAQSCSEEGSVLCNAVDVFAASMDLHTNSCTNVLWLLVREWEIEFDARALDLFLAKEHQSDVTEWSSPAKEAEIQTLKSYVQGLRLQMSGNECWSLTTPRYHDLD